VADAVGYSYSDQGHGFWVLYFPTADKTWVFDVATQTWHERGFWNAPIAKYNAHRSWNHQYAFGKHLVGDWKTGNVYEMSINALDDFGNPIGGYAEHPSWPLKASACSTPSCRLT
jgi:hypothetical protein